ncbi:MAG TPA: hypothetical protein VHK91_04295 [Flavisolibacter sp.]|nr:hypothetical protein [Flavisolibacter sp.]
MNYEPHVNPKEVDDSISMASVKSILINILAAFFRVIDFIGNAIRSNLLGFVLCCIIGTGIGYLYYLMHPKVLKTEMIVYPNDLTRKDYSQIIKNLNRVVQANAPEELSKELNISLEDASHINWIEAFAINDDPLIKDTSTKLNQPFKIQLQLSKVSNVAKLENSLLTYLNNNYYSKLLVENQRKIYLDKLHFIEHEQLMLDSLKTKYNSSLSNSNLPATFYNNALNPADIYVQSNSLANQKEAISRYLNIQSQPIVLIDGFKIPNEFNSIAMKVYLLSGLVIGLVAGLIFSLLAALRKKIL